MTREILVEKIYELVHLAPVRASDRLRGRDHHVCFAKPGEFQRLVFRLKMESMTQAVR